MDRLPRLVSRLGDWVVDLRPLADAGLLPYRPEPYLDIDLELRGPRFLDDLREALFDLLREDAPRLRDDAALREACLIPAASAPPCLPLMPKAFVDFYSGIHHASNVGRMFRPDQPPLLPNYRWMPIGYNGRASTVVTSGVDVIRPMGQFKAPDQAAPTFGATRELDFELEMGFYLAKGSELGERVSAEEASDYVLGLVIVNDWSARDVQRWEYQPLGPFLAKSFATSISPWIVLPDALEPFRIEGMAQDPPPLDHLRRPARSHYDISLEVSLQSRSMTRPQVICRSNTSNLYWSIAQQIAHQASNGTALQAGDLYASGTISGETEDSFGSMLELCWRGEKPIRLEETGEQRVFLEDGDEITMTAYAQGEGYRVGFGEVRTRILPAL